MPSGGVLSPFLYLIYVIDIALKVPKSGTLSQFADDIVAYCSYSCADRAGSLVQKSINVIRENLGRIGLLLEPEKTVLLHVKKGESIQAKLNWFCADGKFRPQTLPDFLGFILITS